MESFESDMLSNFHFKTGICFRAPENKISLINY